MAKKKEKPEEVSLDIDMVSEEITDYLIAKQLELLGYEQKEQYEKCAVLLEEISVFINETSNILNQATSVRRQKLFQHFHQQSEYIHQMIRKEFDK